MTLAICLFLGGVAVGYLWSRWRERRFWHPLYRRYLTSAPMSTTPPTVAQIGPGEMEWGRATDDPGPFLRTPED